MFDISGTINKLYMFDKGCTFRIIFGMPGKKHEDEPTRALKAADNIMKDFHTKNLEASIGASVWEGRIILLINL